MTSSSAQQVSGTSTIFVGSSLDLDQMADSAIASPLLADGDIGLYGHMSGVVTAFQDGTEGSVISTWSGTGAGLVEISQTEPMAIMSVTIANTGTAPLTLPVGTIVSSADGVRYQLVQMPRQEPGWSNAATGPGTAGSYTIQPGASLPLYAQALVDGPSGNLLSGGVTQIGVAGARVTASSLITPAEQWGAGTVTLTNNSNATQVIYQDMVLHGSSGTFQVGLDPKAGGFVATDADASSGYYLLAAGASTTVPVFSVNPITGSTGDAVVRQELAEDAPAGSITGGSLPAGVTVTASSAITTHGVTNPQDQEHVALQGANSGFFTDAQAALFTTYQGYVPTEADVNTYNDYIWTAEDLQNWEAYVDNARAQGMLNLAPMLSEFETVDFATASATQYVRAGALYGGGIAFDMPSWFFLVREPAYQHSVEDEIRWATQNGLRSSITLSPKSGDDQNFMADTQKVVAMLAAAGALPTQFVVKDGGVTGTDTIYSTTDPNALNNVGNWLSGLTLAPSNSEAGLEVRGTTSRPDDVMTGVEQSDLVTNALAAHPFAQAQVFANSRSAALAVTVSLGSVSPGTLSAAPGLGSVSADGSSFSASGTASEVTAALQALSFTAANAALGATGLTTTITDAAGSITGHTALSVDNTVSLTGVAATVAADGPIWAAPAAVVSYASGPAPLTAVVSLSNPALGSIWGTGDATVSPDGSTVTLRAGAGALQSFLDHLLFIPAVGASGQEIETVSVSDGTQVAQATTLIAVADPNRLAVSGVPVDAVAAALVPEAPYRDVLLSDAGSPGEIIDAIVSLPVSGLARLQAVAPGSGTLSADGLYFSFSGTASQLQAALRSLEVTVAASAGGGTEAMTLNINGRIATTVLETPSTDTVFAGAVDANEAAYADTTIAGPLLATGKVGLFDDYNGMTAAVAAGASASLATAWSGAAPGVYGYSEGSDVAQATVTIRNATAAAIAVPVGTLAQSASGVSFQVVQHSDASANAAAGWSAGSTGDGSLGTYVIAPGAEATLPVEAQVQGYAGNEPAGAITGLSGIAGAAVVASQPSLLATEYAGGTVTLTNTTGGYAVIGEGTVLTGQGGSYQIGNDPSAAGFTTTTSDGSGGYYALPAGGSATVPVFGIGPRTAGTADGVLGQILAQAAPQAGSITGGSLPAGVVIAGSSPIAATGPATAAQGAAWGARGADTGVMTQLGYGYFVQGQGFRPSEANTNLDLDTVFTAADLSSWTGYVDTLRALGILNVAPVVTDRDAVIDIANSDATAALRSAALYGGGIAIDLPANYLLSLGQPALTAMADDIRWAQSEGLRSTMTLRAYSDPDFMQNVRSLLSQLQAAGALPSQVVVAGNPDPSRPTDPELANAVAQYVAGLPLTPGAAESGLADTGGVRVDAVMTGVRAGEAVNAPGGSALYAGIQLFGPAAGAMTATVALAAVGLGTLSATGGGSVSADGSTVTLAGTPAQLAARLAAVRFTPVAGASGSTVLNLSVTDAAGTIAGQTVLAVDVPAAAAASAPHPVATAAAATLTVATPASENDALTPCLGGAVSGGVFQVSGPASADLAALAGLKVASGSQVVTFPSLAIGLSGAPVTLAVPGLGHDTVTSGGGNTIEGGPAPLVVQAGPGDTVAAGSGAVFASGTAGFTFVGQASAADTVSGGAGGGSFTAGTGGGSLLVAGSGPTILRAAGANDTLVGGGATTLGAAPGLATQLHAAGGDTAVGADGATVFGPASGTATVQGGAGQETVLGGAGDLDVAGGPGSLDVVLAGGSASIAGGAGAETVRLGTGRVRLDAGMGREVIALRQGVSTGAQLAMSGFVSGRDMLALTGYGSAAAQQLVAAQANTAAGTVLSLSDGVTITLLGVAHVGLPDISCA